MRLRVDLRQMECFVAVAEERSFRAAAERLHMSQPPLSRQIKLLEAELGVTLLTRNARGAVLTDAGGEFLGEAKRTLRQAARAVESARRCAVGKQRLRVGYTTVFDPEVFPLLEPAVQEALAQGSLEFVACTSVELIRRLRGGALDVALIGLPSETGELVVEVLHKEPLVVVLSTASMLARHKLLSLRQIEDQPLFWPQRRVNPGFVDYYQAVFERLGFAPLRRLAEPGDHHVLLAEIAQGRGIGLVPKSMTRFRRVGTTYRSLREKDLWIGFGLAYASTHQAPGLDGFIRLVRREVRRRHA